MASSVRSLRWKTILVQYAWNTHCAQVARAQPHVDAGAGLLWRVAKEGGWRRKADGSECAMAPAWPDRAAEAPRS